ncbi:hypothetical protein NEOLEDRAFT_1072542 [Neolentinus lepideus HHB14362 ss-1]|uniref:Hyaluronan/mRNA-binding protein domain-containing protein n=1 Tax=Neolentinus lepideus HHB14362 ss-1 TaxID=1314782 RepID=A0A165Q7C1_9AGAM|nr:hypothetical protein NEOLEDRAFT_1072542 [Neolentinus lepideus HHB14362 ss-1]
MTRTARANYPRAVSKDRSEARNGLDNSTKKQGAGPHNWGSLEHEMQLEAAGIADEELELVEEEQEGVPVTRAVHADRQRPTIDRSTGSMSEEELAAAREIRRRAAKGGVDLSAIARSSAAVSTSPPNRTIPIANDADVSAI